MTQLLQLDALGAGRNEVCAKKSPKGVGVRRGRRPARGSGRRVALTWVFQSSPARSTSPGGGVMGRFQHPQPVRGSSLPQDGGRIPPALRGHAW